MTWHADLVLLNGQFITLEEDEPIFGALAVKDGRIIYLGDVADIKQFINEQTEVIDVAGKTVLPGFIESHAHPTHMAQLKLELDFTEDDAKEKILAKIEQKQKTLAKGQWILGRGWDENKFNDGSKLTKHDIDAICPDHPVFLKRACGHIALANSCALKLAGITRVFPVKGGLIEAFPNSDEPTGILKERAQELIPVPKYTIVDLMKGFELAQEQFLQYGITTVHDMSTKKRELLLYQQIEKLGKLKVKLRPWLWAIPEFHDTGVLEETIALGIQSGFGSNAIKIQGVKFMFDGSIGGRSAAISFNYLDSEQKNGILYKTDEEIQPFVQQAIENGLRVAIHAIGDRAIHQALNVLEKSYQTCPNTRKMRNRIEHLTLANEAHVRKLQELGIVACSSTNFLYFSADDYIPAIGIEKVADIFPHDLYQKYGVVAPINSDAPVVDANPFYGIYSLVTRKTKNGTVIGKEKALSVIDALKAYTLDAAYSSFEEHDLGSLKVGKIADIIVVNENPLEIAEEKLKDMQVLMTISNGKVVYVNSA